MTVVSTTSAQRYHGSGSTGPFTWSWRFLDNDDVRAYRIAAPNEGDPSLETRELLTEGDDYTLTGAGSYTGGSLTLTGALAVGVDLVVERSTRALQAVDIRNQGNRFFPEIHEDAFDGLTLMVQDRDRDITLHTAEIGGLKTRMTTAEQDIDTTAAGLAQELIDRAAADSALQNQITTNTNTLARALKFPEGDTASPLLPSSEARRNKLMGFGTSGEPTVNTVTFAPLTGGDVSVGSIAALRAMPVVAGSSVIVQGYYAAGDGGGGPIRVAATGAAPGTYVDNGGSVIVPTGGDGSSAWVWEWSGPVNVRWFGARGDGVTDDASKIQTAIDYVCTRSKSLFFPSGDYKVGQPLTLPSGATQWGVELFGEKSEKSYQYLPGSKSSRIFASAEMSSVITNRGASVAYYSSIRNLVIDSNSLADYGYVNGYQDKIFDCCLRKSVIAGISLGDLTNSTVIDNVSLVSNLYGLESVGSNSTVWLLSNSNIRENTSDGAYISSAVHAKIRDCIFESNGGRGIILNGTTDVLKRIDSITIDTCYWENNTGYCIETNRSGSVSPVEISIIKPWLNSVAGKAVNLVYANGVIISEPLFNGLPLTAGYFVVENATKVKIIGNENEVASTSVSISGLLSTNIVYDLIRESFPFGAMTKNIFQAPVYKPEAVIAATNMTLTPQQAAGTIITNRGQAATNVTITLPTNIGAGYSFKAICGTTLAANNWRFATGGPSSILLNGSTVGKAWVERINPTVGDMIEFTSVTLDGTGFSWLATPIVGTWTSY